MADVIVRWSDSSVILTGWGWCIVIVAFVAAVYRRGER